VHAIRNRDRVVSRDELIASVWGGRIVSESTLASRINAARNALGDSGEAQRLIKTIQRKGIRFTGEVREESSAASATVEPMVRPAQDVTFCQTTDGVHLAVATSGSGLPVVKAANWLNHLEFDWQSPVWSPLISLLSDRFRLVRYDERGNGLSDWEAADISFDAFVRDLEAVVDGLGLERFALLGISQGAAVSIAYATRHPERVSRLILCGGYARGWRKRDVAIDIAQREALETLVLHGWGRDNPAFRQVFTSLFIPRRHARTDAMVQRPAARQHLAGERVPFHAHVREYRRGRIAAESFRADSGPAQPRRCPRSVRGRPIAGAVNSGRPLRRARKRQSPDPVARAGMAPLC
jgi:pimeloyl-ACP methyl ester carboxylesterase